MCPVTYAIAWKPLYVVQFNDWNVIYNRVTSEVFATRAGN